MINYCPIYTIPFVLECLPHTESGFATTKAKDHNLTPFKYMGICRMLSQPPWSFRLGEWSSSIWGYAECYRSLPDHFVLANDPPVYGDMPNVIAASLTISSWRMILQYMGICRMLSQPPWPFRLGEWSSSIWGYAECYRSLPDHFVLANDPPVYGDIPNVIAASLIISSWRMILQYMGIYRMLSQPPWSFRLGEWSSSIWGYTECYRSLPDHFVLANDPPVYGDIPNVIAASLIISSWRMILQYMGIYRMLSQPPWSFRLGEWSSSIWGYTECYRSLPDHFVLANDPPVYGDIPNVIAASLIISSWRMILQYMGIYRMLSQPPWSFRLGEWSSSIWGYTECYRSLPDHFVLANDPPVYGDMPNVIAASLTISSWRMILQYMGIYRMLSQPPWSFRLGEWSSSIWGYTECYRSLPDHFVLANDPPVYGDIRNVIAASLIISSWRMILQYMGIYRMLSQPPWSFRLGEWSSSIWGYTECYRSLPDHFVLANDPPVYGDIPNVIAASLTISSWRMILQYMGIYRMLSQPPWPFRLGEWSSSIWGYTECYRSLPDHFVLANDPPVYGDIPNVIAASLIISSWRMILQYMGIYRMLSQPPWSFRLGEWSSSIWGYTECYRSLPDHFVLANDPPVYGDIPNVIAASLIISSWRMILQYMGIYRMLSQPPWSFRLGEWSSSIWGYTECYRSLPDHFVLANDPPVYGDIPNVIAASLIISSWRMILQYMGIYRMLSQPPWSFRLGEWSSSIWGYTECYRSLPDHFVLANDPPVYGDIPNVIAASLIISSWRMILQYMGIYRMLSQPPWSFRLGEWSSSIWGYTECYRSLPDHFVLANDPPVYGDIPNVIAASLIISSWRMILQYMGIYRMLSQPPWSFRLGEWSSSIWGYTECYRSLPDHFVLANDPPVYGDIPNVIAASLIISSWRTILQYMGIYRMLSQPPWSFRLGERSSSIWGYTECYRSLPDHFVLANDPPVYGDIPNVIAASLIISSWRMILQYMGIYRMLSQPPWSFRLGEWSSSIWGYTECYRSLPDHFVLANDPPVYGDMPNVIAASLIISSWRMILQYMGIYRMLSQPPWSFRLGEWSSSIWGYTECYRSLPDHFVLANDPPVYGDIPNVIAASLIISSWRMILQYMGIYRMLSQPPWPFRLGEWSSSIWGYAECYRSLPDHFVLANDPPVYGDMPNVIAASLIISSWRMILQYMGIYRMLSQPPWSFRLGEWSSSIWGYTECYRSLPDHFVLANDPPVYGDIPNVIAASLTISSWRMILQYMGIYRMLSQPPWSFRLGEWSSSIWGYTECYRSLPDHFVLANDPPVYGDIPNVIAASLIISSWRMILQYMGIYRMLSQPPWSFRLGEWSSSIWGYTECYRSLPDHFVLANDPPVYGDIPNVIAASLIISSWRMILQYMGIYRMLSQPPWSFRLGEWSSSIWGYTECYRQPPWPFRLGEWSSSIWGYTECYRSLPDHFVLANDPPVYGDIPNVIAASLTISSWRMILQYMGIYRMLSQPPWPFRLGEWSSSIWGYAECYRSLPDHFVLANDPPVYGDMPNVIAASLIISSWRMILQALRFSSSFKSALGFGDGELQLNWRSFCLASAMLNFRKSIVWKSGRRPVTRCSKSNIPPIQYTPRYN